MPRVPARLWRIFLSLTLLGAVLAAPATVSAGKPIRFTDHAVRLFCDAFGEPGELHLFVEASSEFGSFADLFAWAAPVNHELPPDISGFTEDVTVVESGGGATITVTIPLIDPEEASVGDAIIEAELTPNGEVEILEPFREGNRWIKNTGTIAFMDVTGTLDLPGDLPDFNLEELGCGGEIADVEVFETQPHAFVASNVGVIVQCGWESNGTFFDLFVVNDSFGPYAQAGIFTEGEPELFGETNDVSLSATSLMVEIDLSSISGATATVSAEATLSTLGAPFTSIIITQNSRERATQQRLIPDGTVTFSTGDEFAMDAESCFAFTIDSKLVVTPSSGPKPGGKVPANDTPDGAIPIAVGGSKNAQTGGALPDAELQVTTCPQFDDAFGHTLWYTFTGTGGEVTIDTAGSNFDTVVAVYDDELNELACVDDVEFDPIGVTFQAALTIDTVDDATYYVQVGGFLPFFGEGEAEFGRLRISID